MPSAIFPALCLPRLDLQLPRRFQSLRLRPPVLFLHHLRTHRHLRRRFRCHHHQGPFPHHHCRRFQSLRLRPPVPFLHPPPTHRHLRRRFRCHHHQGPFPHHHCRRFQSPRQAHTHPHLHRC